MALYGAFSTSMLGMMSQARSLHNIGVNIANVNTGGYKGTDTQFSTVLSNTFQNVSDTGGVTPKDKINIAKQGNVVSSSYATDVAINGRGFFTMNTAQDGSGEEVYGRDGSFEIATVNDITVTGLSGQTVTTKDGYLTDKNGYFIQGWSYANGTVDTTATPTSLRVDQYSFINQFQATTQGNLVLNLPAGDAVNDVSNYDIAVYDSLGKQQSVKLNFTKTGVNTWGATWTTSATPVAQVDSVTLAGTLGEVGDSYTVTVNGTPFTYNTTGGEASLDVIRDQLISDINASAAVNTAVTATAGGAGIITLTSDTAGTAFTTTSTATNGGATADNTATQANVTANGGPTTTSTPAVAMTFNSNGTLATPTTLNMALTFASGSTATVALDVSKITQFAGQFLPVSYSKDGFASANMRSFSFNEVGDVIGSFDDNTSRTIYRLSLAVFANPDGLEAVNGNVFKLTPESGSATLVSAGDQGYASIMANARELSNVDIADEFSKMMMTQTAYNAASTVFRTTDEMTVVARDLKR